MSTDARSLATEITKCPIVAAALRGEETPCHDVISWLGFSAGPRYMPEAWTGHLTEAPILFISSNPGADDFQEPVLPDEALTSESPQEEIFRSMDGAFDQGQIPGIIEGTRLVNSRGRPYEGHVRYWIWNKRIARELLGREPVPGRDYALTEVVHCGSKGEFGVWNALETCAQRYLKRVLHLSPATVLVVAGDKALWAFEHELGVTVEGHVWGPSELLGQKRWVLSLPHPNRRGSLWGLDPYFDEKTRVKIRGFLPAGD
jgi:hypothetical protein